MRKHYRKKKSDTYSMYCVSPRITVSANSQMRIKDLDTDREYLNAYDEISGRWFCNLGCGFRYHRDAYDVLDECTTIINGYLTRKAPNDIVRKSQAVAWTYDYDQGVFGCDYELTEYGNGRKRKAQFSVGSVSMKDLDEIDSEIRRWHITGEMMFGVMVIKFGDWEKFNTPKNEYIEAPVKPVAHPAQSAGLEDDDKLPF